MSPAEWNGAVQRTLEAATAASLNGHKANGHPAPPEALQAPEDLRPEPGQVFSPHQVSTFLDCPAKWMFHYHLNLPDPLNGPRHVGACVHRAAEFYFRTRLQQGKPPSLDAVLESFSLAWQDRLAQVEWMEKEDPSHERQLARDLVEVLYRDTWPHIEPAAVELPVDGVIAGVRVRGKLDLIDTEGRIVDFKTAAKSPSGVSAAYRLQATTYDALCPQSRGRATIVTAIKTKTVQIVPQSFDIGPADVQYVETIYPMVRDAIGDGLFYPRRDSMLCSRKWCAYWRDCEKEFGGEVAP